MKSWMALVLGMGFCFCVVPVFAQSDENDPNRQKAATLFEEAQIHYNLQEYEKALAKYKEAYRLSQEPGLLFNMGQCYRQLGLHIEAVRTYKTYLREDPNTPMLPKVQELIQISNSLIVEEENVKQAQPDSTIPTKKTPDNFPKNVVTTTKTPETTSPASEPSTPSTLPTETSSTSETMPSFSEKKAAAKNGLSPWVLYGASAGSGAFALGFAALALSSARQAANAQNQPASNIEEVSSKFKNAKTFGLISDVLLVSTIATGIGGFILSKKSKARELNVSLSPTGVLLTTTF